ncbi:MAG: NEW3 domain-containing protein, partial [Tannerellaceae bacterium]|nr:NEW3 domain-containing protein [Tannerellaceae bacterium]
TNSLNLLVIFLVGILPLKAQSTETEKNIILYTPYTQISVPPGESIDYSVDIINNSEEVINPTISVKGIPRSWEYSLKSGGWTISRIAVLPNEKKTVSLKVEVPMKVNKGTYRFSVHADDLGELPLTVIVSEQGTYQTEFQTNQPNMEGNSKANFNFSATLKNRTAEQQLYALRANAPRGWNVIFKANYKQATSAQVEPNATENISIEITPPANIEAGTYKIPVEATTSTTSAHLELEVVITGSYQMDLTTPRGLLSTDITAGDTKKIDLVIKNTGSAELKDIQLSSNKPADWEVSFEPSSIEKLAVGASSQVTATIRASKKALPGDYITRIEAKTPEVNSNAEFRITVKTPLIYGWLGLVIIVGVLGVIFYLFRKYGRR